MDKMTNPLHARHYADRSICQEVRVCHREQLARQTFLVRTECPSIAQRITPGQFVMVRSPRSDDPLLGRAFAMYDVALDERGLPQSIDIVFHVTGKITRLLADVHPGEPLELWGPLGNGFQSEPVEHLVMVAGGIGQTPFLALAKEYLGLQTFGDQPRNVSRIERVSLCYGARSADLLAGVADFEALGIPVHITTDDGTSGHHGLVTSVLEQVLDETELEVLIVCCGPEPMMEAVSRLAIARHLPCRVSLETPMACGVGICFSCVARVRLEDGSWDYKRTCVDGPVFSAEQIVW